MTASILVPALVSVIASATPLLLAAIGETVVERAGVLNLGQEGIMLLGAVAGFATTSASGSSTFGVLAAALAGMLLALLFGVLTLTLSANQVATGLATTIFGAGLSSLLGARFVGHSVRPLPRLQLPVLSDIPVIGPLLLHQDALVYLSVALTAGAAWFLSRSRAGLVLRAAGESDTSAASLGYDVIAVRYGAVAFGGAASGIAGAYLSLAATPMWMEGLTAGRGWIALALVVFGGWQPWRVLGGAYLFGGISVLQLYLQGAGFVAVPSQVLAMIPYLATVGVLAALSSNGGRRQLRAPACLGKPYRATH